MNARKLIIQYIESIETGEGTRRWKDNRIFGIKSLLPLINKDVEITEDLLDAALSNYPTEGLDHYQVSSIKFMAATFINTCK